jgi:hypothetical protein
MSSTMQGQYSSGTEQTGSSRMLAQQAFLEMEKQRSLEQSARANRLPKEEQAEPVKDEPIKQAAKRVHTPPTADEIASGAALNELLDGLAQARKQAAPKSGPLADNLLSRLNVTKARSSDSIGLLRNGQFTWPEAVSQLIPQAEQTQIEQQVRNLYEQARRGQPDMALLASLRSAIGKTAAELATKVNDLPNEQYREGKRFLSGFTAALNAIGNGELAATTELQQFARGGKDVKELAEFMLNRGLRFAPAAAEDAAAYRAVYDALAQYADFGQAASLPVAFK